MWLREPTFHNVIQTAAQNQYNHSYLQNFIAFTHAFKFLALQWKRNTFGNIFQMKTQLLSHLDQIQQNLSPNLDPDLLRQEQEIQHKLNHLSVAEELFWQQRSHTNWLKLGDQNTTFFQTKALIRRKKKQILSITDNDGIIHTDTQSISSILTRAFRQRFIPTFIPSPHTINHFLSIVPTIITESDNIDLLRPISDEEIFTAVSSIGALKAPGPDGLPALFYHTYWNDIKHHIIPLVKDFFHSNISISDINHTNIVLIPKNADPTIVNHYRPISLCNASYKIISKIIVLRHSLPLINQKIKLVF